MDKKSRRIDRLQNLAIAMLTLSFLLLLLQTPLFTANGETLSSTVHGWFSDSDHAAPAEEDSLTALSVPVRIVQTGDFLRSGSDALTTADDAFEPVGTLFSEAIRSAHSLSTVTEGDFLSALSGSGVYLEFACDLPLEVFCARLSVQPPTTHELDIRRCFLSVGESDSAQLYLQDAQHTVLCFSTALSTADILEYLEVQSGNSVDFAFLLGEEYASLSPYTLLFDVPSARSELSAANALSDYSTEELLRRAEFNPHTQDWYTESSGTVVYIEGQRKLYLHTDGTLSYNGTAAAEEDSLFAVAAADSTLPTYTELCVAARSLISTLTQGHLGDAALYLSGIDGNEQSTLISFDYMVNGTPILFSDGEHAVAVRIEGSSITAFTMRLRRYTLTEQDSLLLPTALARAVAQCYSGCALSIAYVDAYTDTVRAGWVAD